MLHYALLCFTMLLQTYIVAYRVLCSLTPSFEYWSTRRMTALWHGTMPCCSHRQAMLFAYPEILIALLLTVMVIRMLILFLASIISLLTTTTVFPFSVSNWYYVILAIASASGLTAIISVYWWGQQVMFQIAKVLYLVKTSPSHFHQIDVLYCLAVFGHFSPAPVKTDRAVGIQ